MIKYNINDYYRKDNINYFDLKLGRYFAALDSDPDPLVSLTFALTSRETAAGHVCLDLVQFTRQPEFCTPQTRCDIPSAANMDVLLATLRRHPAVGEPGQRRPFILDDHGRLYLFRYWQYENFLAERIRERASRTIDITDIPRFKDGFWRLFPEESEQEGFSDQTLAAAIAALKPFCVISGGPGTGKTSLISKILIFLLAHERGGDMHVHLTAPTGKAAARLTESIHWWTPRLEASPAIAAAMPTEARTIHRTLGGRWGTPYFDHNTDNPLSTDLVVVDEASMVDIALMAKLVSAIPTQARLILVGDRDQLASVEPGAVFGDICPKNNTMGFSGQLQESIRYLTGRDPDPVTAWKAGGHPATDTIISLKRSYRFSEKNGIGRLAHAVNQGHVAAALETLEDPIFQQNLTWIHGDPETLTGILAESVLDGFTGCLTSGEPEKALEIFNRFRVLCAVKAGPFGVAALNDLAFRVLRAHGLIPSGSDTWYHGRPILITRNDYRLNLFNGDFGIVVSDRSGGGTGLTVCFPGPSGAVRRISPRRLPAHETAFAMTVHKSQGSEFDKVLLILPDKDSPVLTRELIYTAITRAREHVMLCGERAIIAAALDKRIERSSGLRDALWE